MPQRATRGAGPGMTAAPERDADPARSQTVKAQIALRDLILSGALKPGDRISELSMVDRLGVSRTPVRMALVRLEEEGLLEAIPSGGFSIKSFSERDVFDAIEIRGTLEGLAARFAAERGPSASDLAAIRDCLAELDEVVEAQLAGGNAFATYIELNARFHAMLLELARSPSLARQVERASALPFASPSSFVMVQADLPEARTVLTVAQDHHRCVVDAIEAREGARAEAIMREHARLASRNLRYALRNQEAFDLIPGAALLRRRGRP
jgi:GntR family transcriptional regulator, vanillate catabolism transcriptional regulator